jgi:hypothetical protein
MSQDRARVNDGLEALGFVHSTGVCGEFVSYQASYILDVSDSSTHVIDLHWKISNSELMSQLFSYGELLSQSIQLPRLCRDALSAGPVHALLIACMHRAVHELAPYYVDDLAHHSGDRLIWLYDIHLLAESFNAAHWRDFLRLARLKGLGATCAEGLMRARECFDTHCPEHVFASLNQSDKSEPTAKYLNGGRLRRSWMDFHALNGARDKWSFLGELVFPSAAYMRQKYSEARFDWLPWLYVRRASAGVVKWMNSRRPHR